MKTRRITRTFALLIACLMAFALTASAVDVIDATSEFYVNDQSGIISDENRAYILSTAAELDDQTGAQICVVTVDFLGGADIADYAYALFNDWGIGSAAENNGVLLLVTIGEENYYLLQGKGLESVLSSGKLQTILDEDMEPDFAVGNYDESIRKTYDRILDELCSYYGVSVSGAASQYSSGNVNYTTSVVPDYDYQSIPRQEDYYEEEIEIGGFSILIAVLVIFALVIAVIVIVIRSVFRSVGRSVGGFIGFGRPYNPYRNLHRRTPPPPPGGPGSMGGMGHMGGFGPRPGGFNSRPNSRPGGGMGSSRPGGSGFSGGSRGGAGRSGGFSGGGRSGSGRSGGGGSSRGGGAGRR